MRIVAFFGTNLRFHSVPNTDDNVTRLNPVETNFLFTDQRDSLTRVECHASFTRFGRGAVDGEFFITR